MDSAQKVRRQIFLKTYLSRFPFIRECKTKGEDSKFYAYCVYCSSDIFIGAGGANDILRHSKSMKHKKREECHNEQPRLNVFMKNRQLDLSVQQRELADKKEKEAREREEAEAKEKKLKEDTIRAEVMMVELIADLNLSMNAASTLTSAFKVMFHDSAIAQQFQCSRTKTTAIIKDLSSKHKALLVDRMKSGPFSLATDGSNDSNAKLFPIVVRTVNPVTLSVVAEVVSLPVLEDSATGKNIFDLLDSLLRENDISWLNCVSFGCDNAAVMTGVYKGVMSFIHQKNPNCVMSGCTLHLVHIAAEKAANQLPYQPADLLVDIYYYMKKSSVRLRNLNMWQAYYDGQQRGVLKHVSTRWLSVSRCIDRLISDWRPLRSFFEDEVKVKTKSGTAANAKAKSIYSALCSDTAKACCLFVQYACKLFDPFLVSNQSDSPKIHTLLESMQKLMINVIHKFVKPGACTFKGAFDIDFTVGYNVKEVDEVCVGSETEKFLKEKKFAKPKKAEFIKSVVRYYTTVCQYLKDNLPHDSKFLLKVQAAAPHKLVEDKAITRLKYIMAEQPVFIPVDASLDLVESQLIRLQHILLEGKLQGADESVDKIWALQASDPDTRFACLFLLNLLVVPHSSASCERVFSYVRKIKTDQRAKMGDRLLEALIIVKHIPSSPIDRHHSSEMLLYLKGSCMRAVGKCGDGSVIDTA